MSVELRVVDAEGEPLQTGDGVVSTRRFDAGHIHKGKITSVDVTLKVIGVQHAEGCCEIGRHSESADPKLWKRVVVRPTAWQRILGDDE